MPSFASMPAILGGPTWQDGRVTEPTRRRRIPRRGGPRRGRSGPEPASRRPPRSRPTRGCSRPQRRSGRHCRATRTSVTIHFRRRARRGASSSAAGYAEATQERPSVLREAGLTALQVWDATGPGRGPHPGQGRPDDPLHRPGRVLELVDEGGRRSRRGPTPQGLAGDRAAGQREHRQGREAPRRRDDGRVRQTLPMPLAR